MLHQGIRCKNSHPACCWPATIKHTGWTNPSPPPDNKTLKFNIEIKTRKTEAKKILKLEEKVKAQRQIKDLEKKRNAMRRDLYQMQDDVDEKKEALIAEIEGRLRQKIDCKELFLIKWRLV